MIKQCSTKSIHSVYPSSYVRSTKVYKKWCSITVCSHCQRTAKYEDAHPVNPCTNCGEKVKERVGRWVETSRWWNWMKQGYWIIKDGA